MRPKPQLFQKLPSFPGKLREEYHHGSGCGSYNRPGNLTGSFFRGFQRLNPRERYL